MILIGVEMYVLYVVDLNYKGVCLRMILIVIERYVLLFGCLKYKGVCFDCL